VGLFARRCFVGVQPRYEHAIWQVGGGVWRCVGGGGEKGGGGFTVLGWWEGEGKIRDGLGGKAGLVEGRVVLGRGRWVTGGKHGGGKDWSFADKEIDRHKSSAGL